MVVKELFWLCYQFIILSYAQGLKARLPRLTVISGYFSIDINNKTKVLFYIYFDFEIMNLHYVIGDQNVKCDMAIHYDIIMLDGSDHM